MVRFLSLRHILGSCLRHTLLPERGADHRHFIRLRILWSRVRWFAARPFGAAIFGNLADLIGRKRVLVATLLIMGIATAAIGLLPTYVQIGVGAPILLVSLRLIQGIGVGGEWGAAVLMSVEHAPPGRKGFFGAIPQMGSPVGVILSTGALALLALLPKAQFLS